MKILWWQLRFGTRGLRVFMLCRWERQDWQSDDELLSAVAQPSADRNL